MFIYHWFHCSTWFCCLARFGLDWFSSILESRGEHISLHTYISTWMRFNFLLFFFFEANQNRQLLFFVLYFIFSFVFRLFAVISNKQMFMHSLRGEETDMRSHYNNQVSLDIYLFRFLRTVCNRFHFVHLDPENWCWAIARNQWNAEQMHEHWTHTPMYILHGIKLKRIAQPNGANEWWTWCGVYGACQIWEAHWNRVRERGRRESQCTKRVKMNRYR